MAGGRYVAIMGAVLVSVSGAVAQQGAAGTDHAAGHSMAEHSMSGQAIGAQARGAEGQAAAVDCPAPSADQSAAPSASLPPELAGWRGKPVVVRAAPSQAKLPAAGLTIGHRIDAALLPTPKVEFPVRPDKPGGSVSKSGLFGFDVPEDGLYRVALGSGPWVDVIEDGRALVSVAHGHGPDCSGIRKMVDYELKAGPHILQISGNGDAALALMVVKLR